LNRDEALALLRERIGTLRDLSYTELLRYLDNATAEEVIASGGQVYQIEVEAMWDDQPHFDLRVLASIDDGSLRWATVPLVQDFIIRPDGTFVGE
jgi:hypothetical protein